MTPRNLSQQPSPTIVAHRGLHQRYPENSLAAFEAAWDAGIEWCECDVRTTSCGTVIVFHDDLLDRMTTLSGRVDQCSWQRMSDACLRLEDGAATEHPICLLESACARVGTATAAGGRRRLLIEIKAPCGPEAIHRIVNVCRSKIDAEMDSPIAIQSFDAGVVSHVRRLQPGVPIYLLLESTDRLDLNPDAPWAGINVQHDLLNPQLVAHLREVGKSIGVWTPNAEADLHRAIELGVDTIITDEPLLAKGLVAEEG